MNLLPYTSYKPSKVEWAGDIPAHWNEKRLRFVAIRSDEKMEADADNPVQYVGMEHIESWTGKLLPLDVELVPSGISNRFRCGDVLFGKLRPYLAKASVLDFDGLCSSELLVLKTRNHDRKYLLYQLLSEGFISVVDSSTYGAKMPRASWDFIGACSVPCPDLDEQHAIADFLDRETVKLDTLVEKKRALIEKLKEKRAALISRTVTRGLPPDAARAAGLNPHPKLKPSGIEWLGDVPEHWEVKRLKMSVHLTDNKVEADAENPVPYIGMENIESWTGQLLPIDPEVIPTGTANAFTAGYTLFGKLRPYLAKACNPDFDGLCSTELLVLKGVALERRTLLYSLLSDGFIKLVDSSTYGSKMPRASWDFVGNCLFPIAPPEEQRIIADFLDHETAKLDRMVEKVEAAIERLREYRTALITAAVTGKIDVRKKIAA